MKRLLSSRADWWAVAVLTSISSLLFVVPSILGHPPVAGDNLIQNFPLRVLSGKIMATGHLPQWNTLAYSGTPLMGGLNAGSLYPLTFLFIVLPGALAWVLNLIACYVAAALGVYALTRWLGINVVPAFLGAVTYTFMGMMVGQLVHLGVIQGQGLIPWVVLLMLMTTKRLQNADTSLGMMQVLRGATWPLLGLVGVVAFIFLTGEPRSIVEFETVGVLVFLYCVWWAERGIDRPRRFLVACALGVATMWGVAISAIQLLPGYAFIGISQRSNLTETFFGSGSIRFEKTVLFLIPDFFGGSGIFHQPSYFIDYNLPEVSGYVGMIGLAALFAAATQLFGPHRKEIPRWIGLFVVMAVVGLVFAWGEFTPFIHVMSKIPLINKTRLQSRNLAIVDLAAAVLVAWFVQHLIAGERSKISLDGWRKWVTLSPLFGALLVGVLVLVWPFGTEQWFGALPNQAVEGHFLFWWITVSLFIIVASILILTKGFRLGAKVRQRVVVGFVVVDAAFFMLACTTGLAISSVPAEPSSSYAASQLGTSGRFALVDPGNGHGDQFIPLGQPNTNVFTNLPSIQGYGSLIGQSYGDATGAHLANNLDACGLSDGSYRQLRLDTLVVANWELAPQIVALENGVPVNLPVSTPPACPHEPPVAQGSERRFYFGQSLALSSAFFIARSSSVMNDTSIANSFHVQAISSNGKVSELSQQITPTSTGWAITFPAHPDAVGLVVTGPVSKVMDTSTVTDTSGSIYSLNGEFQGALDRASWSLVSTSGTLQTFRTTRHLVPWVYLSGAGSGSRVLSSVNTITGSQTDVVHLEQAGTLVRSEAFLPGWSATVTPVQGGATTSAPVIAHDLVQSVNLPPGDWSVTLSYQAPRLNVGEIITGVGLGAFVLVIASVFVGFLRRRSHSRA